ncbi:hypothetical protein ACOMHN_005763 [Nucella lapillus]
MDKSRTSDTMFLWRVTVWTVLLFVSLGHGDIAVIPQHFTLHFDPQGRPSNNLTLLCMTPDLPTLRAVTFIQLRKYRRSQDGRTAVASVTPHGADSFQPAPESGLANRKHALSGLISVERPLTSFLRVELYDASCADEGTFECSVHFHLDGASQTEIQYSRANVSTKRPLSECHSVGTLAGPLSECHSVGTLAGPLSAPSLDPCRNAIALAPSLNPCQNAIALAPSLDSCRNAIALAPLLDPCWNAIALAPLQDPSLPDPVVMHARPHADSYVTNSTLELHCSGQVGAPSAYFRWQYRHTGQEGQTDREYRPLTFGVTHSQGPYPQGFCKHFRSATLWLRAERYLDGVEIRCLPVRALHRYSNLSASVVLNVTGKQLYIYTNLSASVVLSVTEPACVEQCWNGGVCQITTCWCPPPFTGQSCEQELTSTPCVGRACDDSSVSSALRFHGYTLDLQLLLLPLVNVVLRL